MKIKLPLQFFAADGTEGGGGGVYDSIPLEQLDSVFGDFEEPSGNNPSDNFFDEEHDFDSSNEEEIIEQEVQKYLVKADGQDHEMTIEEMMEKASAGINFTRKSQELANQQKEWEATREAEKEQIRAEMMQEVEAERAELSQMAQLRDILNNNPELAQMFSQNMREYFQNNPQAAAMLNQQPQTQQPQFDISSDPQFKELQDRFEQTQSQLNQFLDMQRRNEALSEWQSLVSRYPDAENMKRELAQFADENNVNLEVAYRNLAFESIGKQKEEQLAKQAQKKLVARTQSPAGSKGANDAPKKPNSYEDAWKLAMSNGLNPFE